jgi:hypothetical protein
MSAFSPERRRNWRKQGPFTARVVIWLVLIGTIAFIGSLIVGAFGDDWDKGDDGQAHALSRSAIGFAGVVDLLRKTGTEVEISRTEYPDESEGGILIMTPPAFASPDNLDEIAFDGQVLVVLGKWTSSPTGRGWVRGRGVMDPAESLRPINDDKTKAVMSVSEGTAPRTLLLADGKPFAVTGPIDGLRTLTGGGWIPVVKDSRGGIVLGRKGENWVLSDPDFLNTQGVTDLKTASAGLRMINLLRWEDEPVIFDVFLNGLKSRLNLLQLALKPPFLGVTLALFLGAVLLALQAAGRFGPPVERGRSIALGKRALADNTAGLIRLARREHRMAERYALYVRTAAARAVGAPHGLDEAELEGLLDRMSAQQGLEPFTKMRREAAEAKDLSAALSVAGRLYSWRLEMTRERR